MGPQLKAKLKTPLGIAEIVGDIDGISRIEILDPEEFHQEEIPVELLEAAEQLQDYFSGKIQKFKLKINTSGTDFQKEVWNALNKIPYGETRTYLQLSKELGNVKAIRAVAAANGKNPLWIVTPCHRVIGSDGSLTGYAGGLWRKKWLLDFENPPLQQELF
jgi:methylated-DNA-[protein]-cysteine S-methyltransferase